MAISHLIYPPICSLSFAYMFSMYIPRSRRDLFVYLNICSLDLHLLFSFTKPSRVYDVIDITAHLLAINYTQVSSVRKLMYHHCHPAPVVRERWRFAIRIASLAAAANYRESCANRSFEVIYQREYALG
jgi:S-adenosylmethionine:diacylglycerol 3-amino-3-carboxypropyl transferase